MSALEQLNPQNALDMGALAFELTAGDKKTHCGVLEFTAQEGSIGLSPTTARSLMNAQGEVGKVAIRYVRLSRGKKVVLEPLGSGFGERQIDFKELLEKSLKLHTTLTDGDILLVRQGGQTFNVAVRSLTPEPQVMILNIDLEVDLLPSEEISRQMQAKQQAQAAEKAHQERQSHRAKQLIPESQQPDALKCSVKMPDGKQVVRRTGLDEPLQRLFDLVVAHCGDQDDSFRLVCLYPRREFYHHQANSSLKELGFTGRQERFHVERLLTDAKESALTDSASEIVQENESKWVAARKQAMELLDHQPGQATAVHALEPLLPTVASEEPREKWAAQLQELETMVRFCSQQSLDMQGFVDTELNISLLERYQGRMLRVINRLSEL